MYESVFEKIFTDGSSTGGLVETIRPVGSGPPPLSTSPGHEVPSPAAADSGQNSPTDSDPTSGGGRGDDTDKRKNEWYWLNLARALPRAPLPSL